MAADIPTSEPLEHQAGTTLKFDRCLPDFPADEWTLYYSLRSSSGDNAPIEITSAANGTDHRVNEAAATTEIWNAGEYLMVGYVTDIATGLEKHQVYRAQLTITPWLGGLEPVEWRTYAQRMLAKVQDAIAGRVARDTVSYSINGRSFTMVDSANDHIALDYWQSRVNYEANGRRGRKILVRYRNPR